MGLMDELQNMIRQGTGSNERNVNINTGRAVPVQPVQPGASGGIFGNVLTGMGGRGGILGSSALGGLLGVLSGGRALRGALGGGLLAGGVQLWNRYRQRVQEESAAKAASYGDVPAPPDERAARIIRALVYAAKSDGYTDPQEQKAIGDQIAALNLGAEGERLVHQALNEPLDPLLIAKGVQTPDEALELFTMSLAVVRLDNTMEQSYLEELAKALNIPQDVKDDLLAKAKGQAE